MPTKRTKREDVLSNINSMIDNRNFESYQSYQAMIQSYTVNISDTSLEKQDNGVEVGFFDWTPSGTH